MAAASALESWRGPGRPSCPLPTQRPELRKVPLTEAALAPVVVGQAVVALGPGAPVLAVTVAGLVAAVGHRAYAVAVAVCVQDVTGQDRQPPPPPPRGEGVPCHAERISTVAKHGIPFQKN